MFYMHSVYSIHFLTVVKKRFVHGLISYFESCSLFWKEFLRTLQLYTWQNLSLSRIVNSKCNDTIYGLTLWKEFRHFRVWPDYFSWTLFFFKFLIYLFYFVNCALFFVITRKRKLVSIKRSYRRSICKCILVNWEKISHNFWLILIMSMDWRRLHFILSKSTVYMCIL